jgi:hypothetical protein
MISVTSRIRLYGVVYITILSFSCPIVAWGAFPVVEDVTAAVAVCSNSNTHNQVMPATVTAGDLLIAFRVYKRNGVAPTITTPMGWTSIDQDVVIISAGANELRHAIFAKDAVGDEDGTNVNFATSATSTSMGAVYRISAWEGTLAGLEVSTVVQGVLTTAPDSGSLTPSWGAADTLWISAFLAGDDDDAVSAYPTDYTNGTQSLAGCGANASSHVGTARRELNTTVQNPGAYTLAAGEGWSAWTLAIEPSGVAVFTVNPTVTSQTATAYTIGGTTGGSVTVSAVGCPKDQTAPTIAQAVAGNCTGDVAAEAIISETWNGADTFVLDMGMTPFAPVTDIYVTEGTNLVSLVDECLDAATGKQIINCPTGLTSIGAGGAVEELNAAITPDWAVGDIPICDLETTPGGTPDMTFTLSVAGLASYIEGDGTRQYANCDAYDLSVGALHTVANADNDLDWWDQEPGPSCGAAFNWIAAEDVEISAANPNTKPIDLDTLCSHPYADPLSYATTTGTVPAGCTLTDGVLCGTETPITEDEDGEAMVFTATSTITGATATQGITAYIWNTITLLINCVDGATTLSQCQEAIESQFLYDVTTQNPLGTVTVSSSEACDPAIGDGFVASQDPAVDAELAVFGSMALVVSSGDCGDGGADAILQLLRR